MSNNIFYLLQAAY